MVQRIRAILCYWRTPQVSATRHLSLGMLLGLLWAASPCLAQPTKREIPPIFAQMFSDPNAAAPQAVSFSAGPDNQRFILDRSQPRVVLLQFDGDPEVWALTSQWGPRGDEFLRNDIGEVMVRITAFGGVTIYGPLGNGGGLAASMGRVRSLPAPLHSAGSLKATLEKALGWFDKFSNRTIRVEATRGLAPGLVHEALERAAQAMSRAPRGFFGHPERQVKRIRIQPSLDRPSVTWQAGILTIGVVPGRGYAGRPSSAAVLLALTSGS
ncbi:DUF4908 domain-containing protein [Candidatus Phycosocius spiralis]|uniref:Uncharacterized protein n=1 Tax=Candidatus Phycosocius spiralis TaxID=2815099 RepID=A0ABQ4PXP5_9PROT|nr:DUF4908 domain-containing protein [Candidatus Phycosocius spiralis]GIU67716.1 hypothetical protein PsB1_1870 [Candidatus Phycosocius spiralis]